VTPPAPAAERARRRLRAWYRREARPLPWRERPSLYGVWIAEIMLQQTTVATVVPFWERFLARFPDVRALAAADESEVLAQWTGLGYYRRARRLHAAARSIIADNGGVLPRDREGWRALPGVGAYAAGAIASIGAGRPVPAVDVNVARVLTRLSCADIVEADGLGPTALESLAGAWLDRSDPGQWNQALMELGAGVCRPAEPRCGDCPLAEVCRARAAGTAASLPAARPSAAPVPSAGSLLVLWRGGRVLLAEPGAAPAVVCPGWGDPVRDDFSRLWRGLWGLPATPWYPAATPGGVPADPATAAAAWRRTCGDREGGLVHAGVLRHAVTRYRLKLHVFSRRLPRGAADPAGLGGRWADPDADLPLSSLARKAIRLARSAAEGSGAG